jgi:hypothetical protein
MKQRKKFKTFAGYLRSMGDELYYAQEKAKLRGGRPIPEDEGQRQIINNLLTQVGTTGRVGLTENPRDGVKRLQAEPQTERAAEALAACAKWLAEPRVRATFVGASATHHSTIFAGETFSEEEWTTVEKIARERAVETTEAVRIFRDSQSRRRARESVRRFFSAGCTSRSITAVIGNARPLMPSATPHARRARR